MLLWHRGKQQCSKISPNSTSVEVSVFRGFLDFFFLYAHYCFLNDLKLAPSGFIPKIALRA